MGYRGKVEEQNRARDLRARAGPQELLTWGRTEPLPLDDRDLPVAGTALYAGEGTKTDGEVRFTNTDPRMIALFCWWLRRFVGIDESRRRVRLYLHEGLDLDAAAQFWSELTGIPQPQFRTPYRAAADPSIRRAKHVYGCPTISYRCARTHRRIMGLVAALLS